MSLPLRRQTFLSKTEMLASSRNFTLDIVRQSADPG